MREFQRIVKNAHGLHRKLAEAIGNPRRVWCKKCGREQAVDAARCLASGWPKCCGYTMTIDDPAGPFGWTPKINGEG